LEGSGLDVSTLGKSDGRLLWGGGLDVLTPQEVKWAAGGGGVLWVDSLLGNQSKKSPELLGVSEIAPTEGERGSHMSSAGGVLGPPRRSYGRC
jgi:hypothetical protein